MTTTAPVISRTSASSQCPERVPAYRVYAQLTSTSALQRGMLSYIAFKHRRRHRLEDNSVTCATPHCSSSTEAYQPRTNALKSVVDSTTAFLFLQPMSVAVKVCRRQCPWVVGGGIVAFCAFGFVRLASVEYLKHLVQCTLLLLLSFDAWLMVDCVL